MQIHLKMQQNLKCQRKKFINNASPYMFWNFGIDEIYLTYQHLWLKQRMRLLPLNLFLTTLIKVELAIQTRFIMYEPFQGSKFNYENKLL